MGLAWFGGKHELEQEAVVEEPQAGQLQGRDYGLEPTPPFCTGQQQACRQQAQQWGQSHQLWLTPHELVQAAPLQLQSQQIQMQYYYKAHAITPQGACSTTTECNQYYLRVHEALPQGACLAWRPWLRQLQQQVRPCAPAELQLLEPPALPYSHHFK
ncbi:MAG: hypothetical protein FRX49_13122, partial [Trebouxia sp. A1-2]